MSISDHEAATAPSSNARAKHSMPEVGEKLAGRFELVEVLGAGAHGVVYAARDELSGDAVALKVLTRLDPDELYRFKREFRVLADVNEENLVTLHELFVEESRAFFTMELIRGVDFVSYVRGEEDDALDVGRLREALRQLATGLCALHAAGKLHRDLKPSNVLVREDGRVFLADFGLAAELAGATTRPELVGTPAYMSPEQAAGLPLAAASDWYSVGVMLYEAITGSYPFSGVFGRALLLVKQGPPPPPPSSVHADVDPEFDDLCHQLLARDPEGRPAGADVLRRLGGESSVVWAALEDAGPIGRDDELERLRDAFRYARTGWKGRASVQLISGASGAGKTTLVDAFVGSLPEEAQVLRGRCYERESVPYKGLDELVDALRECLHERGRRGESLDPVGGAAALVRLFPVLADVPGVGDVDMAATAEDPVELRRQAVDALGEILARLGRKSPVVVVLADLQWIDPDTAALLASLLRPGHRPPLLFMATFRDDAAERSEPFRRLRRHLRDMISDVRVDEFALGPLDPSGAEALAQKLLGVRSDANVLAASIADESHGSPLFITELVRYVESGATPERGTGLTLEQVIQHRVDRLPSSARALLEVICVAAGPVERAVAIAAAELSGGVAEAFAVLRTRSLVLAQGVRPKDSVEPFHDRIRAAVVGALDAPRLVRRHARLAEELERRVGDPEAVAIHLQGAGLRDRAVAYVARAAEQAAEALAFKRAARLFQVALGLVEPDDRRRTALQVGLADAWANDARSADAATAYRRAAESAQDDEVVSLRRNAAEQLLRSGRTEEGISELRGVMDSLDLYYPGDARVALAALMVERTRLRGRGMGFVERAEAELDIKDLLRVDATWTAASGLQQVDVMIGQYFQAKHLTLALQCGEPHRVARALGLEAMYAATSGTLDAERTDALLERVLGLARRLGDPRAEALAWIVAGAWDAYRGRFAQARPHLERAERLLRSRCVNAAWELSMARTFQCMALHHEGDYLGLQRTMQAALLDAAERDDHHTALMLGVAFESAPALAAGDVGRARAILAEYRRRWPAALESSTYRYVALLTEGRIERFAGQPKAAWAVYERHWSAVRRSLMLTKQPFRIFLLPERACSALGAAREAKSRERRRLIRLAARDKNKLFSEGTAWSRAMALTLEPAQWMARGDRVKALASALEAERALEERGLAVHAAAMRVRRGELTTGPRGAALIESAFGVMRRRSIEAPSQMADMLVPPVLGWATD